MTKHHTYLAHYENSRFSADSGASDSEFDSVRFWMGVKIAVIVFGLIGSVCGIIRIRELRHEQECLAELSKWNQLGIALKQEACRAIVDHDHPARGLVALSNAIYDALDAQLQGGVQ